MIDSDPTKPTDSDPGLNLPKTPTSIEAQWLSVTLYSIGDAVIATDNKSNVTFMNPVAETLTGWSSNDAVGQPLANVFNIINEATRKAVESPVTKALREGVVVGLADHTLLIARDGTERPIDDSAAPIRNGQGQVAGVVLVFRDISERKLHEQAIQGALDYAQNILRTLHEPFLVLDKDLRIVTTSDAFCQTFKVDSQHIQGQLIFDLGNGQWNIPKLRDLLLNILPENHSFDEFEVEHDFPSIGKRIMLLNARRIKKPGDHSEQILLAIEDATERLLLARKLHISEQRYRRLFESARDGILILDAGSMTVIDANPFMTELLGYSASEFQGKHLWEIGLFKDKTQSLAAVQQLKDTGYVRYEDLPLESDQGSLREVEFICNTYPEDGYLVAQCNIRDITERKKQELALRKSEEQYRTLFTSIDEGFCIVQMIFDEQDKPIDYRFIQTNPAFESQTGLVNAQGKTMRQLLPEHESFWFETYGRIALTGESSRFEHRAEGLLRYFDVYAFRHGDPQNRQVAILFNDITSRIQMQDTISDHARSLADMHRRKDEFLAMLSHELRNPLAPILSALQLIKYDDQQHNTLQQEARGVIHRQVNHLSKLVDDLLEVSRITTGRIHLHLEQVDINSIIERSIERVQPLITRAEQQLTVTKADDVLWVKGDTLRLEQAFGNLLTNASKYSHNRGRIWIDASASDGQVIIQLRDEGVGIAAEQLLDIFDLFTQADKSLDRSQGGLGIGLALAKNLIEMHHGTLVAQSDGLEKGSTFTMTLPLSQTVGSDLEPDVPSEDDSQIHALRVLVVDDNMDGAKMSAMLLQAWGHKTRFAYDGKSALELAKRFAPQVILLDLGLPDMDGYEVARRIRKDPALKQIQLVAITGYGQQSDRQRTTEAGFDAHMVKPVEHDALRKMLADIKPVTN